MLKVSRLSIKGIDDNIETEAELLVCDLPGASAQCTVQCTVHSAQCTVQCTVHSAQCTVHSWLRQEVGARWDIKGVSTQCGHKSGHCTVGKYKGQCTLG